MEELVSIVMPTYNCAAFIEESIKSIIAQHHKNWELIIVDDCSTDNTKAVLAPYLAKYPNIHYTCLEKNSGPAVARSEALKQAKGDYIAFLDSDDLWTPNKLSLQIDFMKQNKAAFSATGYEWINEDGSSKGVALIPPKITSYSKLLRLGCPIGNLTCMYDRRIIGEQQVPSIKKRNDYALWLQTLHKTNACYGMPDVLAKYRIRTSSISRNKLALLPYHWHLYRHIEKLGIIKSAWYILCWAFIKGTKIGINKVRLEDLHKRDIADSVLHYE
ncbi:MAG: glycosyltransferase family 2 protein [Elusimicrobiaceae bacterium]|nr:glycosyltransferase family 2 protein [Elusimicrobiaceae bacterium]